LANYVDNTSELRRSIAVVCRRDRQALSTARFRRAGQLATADTCFSRKTLLAGLTVGDRIHRMTVTQFYSISMPVGFRRRLVGKTLRNVCYCNIA